MVMKIATLLMVVGACLAYPAEDEVRPPGTIQNPERLELLPEPAQSIVQDQPMLVQEQIPEGSVLEQDPVEPDTKPESDLKTEATSWRRRYYSYPQRYYSRYHYRPSRRSYGYNYYYTPYWNSYYW